MVLFRPYRDVSELAGFCFGEQSTPRLNLPDVSAKGANDPGSHEDQMWSVVYREFPRWKWEDVDEVAARFSDKSSEGTVDPPKFGTKEWWACMISEKLSNYDAAMRKHRAEASLTPDDLEELPEFQPPLGSVKKEADANQGGHGSEHSAEDSGLDRDSVIVGDEGGPSLEELSQRRAPATSNPASLFCGVMLEGKSLDSFHRPPSKIHSRSAEGKYWQDFSSQVNQSFSKSEDGSDIAYANLQSWGIGSADAISAAVRQADFFKVVDRFQPEETTNLDPPAPGQGRRDHFEVL